MEALETTYPDKKKMKRWKRVSLIIGMIVLILIVGILFFVNGYINRSLPEISGEINIEGLHKSVSVTRDEHGVPHINASNAHDLFMAQGFVQAQDRLFQMELSRRQASGTLSEVIGEATIKQDKYFRTLGLRRAAEASLPKYSAEAIQSLQAFADGVNAYMEKAIEENSLPPGFALMGIEPKPWNPIDSLTIGKYMAFDLGGHWERQAFNYYLLNEFPEAKALELFPTYPEDAPTILNEAEPVNVAASFKDAVIPPEFNGSNNWVLSGERTASGYPLLADDPHLGLAAPSIWYQMHLNSPEYQVSGVIFAGIPGIILGHNEDIAWGVTNVGPDVQQLYIEKRNPKQPDEFLFEGEWEQAEVISEPIKVKGEETIDYKVLETRHGPVISEFAEKSGEDVVMSLRWTALDPTTELEAVLEINQASNWKEFEAGLEKFLAPAQNFVFASKEGTIAYKANGRIPIYEDGDDALLPLRGWEQEDEWQGYIPFDELPTTVNPEKGYIATANNKVVSESYPYHISHNWAQPYRYQRIVEMIETKEEHTLDSMKAMQLDVKNLQAVEFLPYMVKVAGNGEDEAEQTALDLLKKWEYQDLHTLPQPLIFHTWMENIEDTLYNETIPKDMQDLFHGMGQTTDELLRDVRNGGSSIWIEEAGGIERVVQESLSVTIEELSTQFGENPQEWSWGEHHAVEFTHPLSSIAMLERFYNPGDPVPVSGSRVTVRAAGYNANGIVNYGASWRYVIDLANPTAADHVVGPGQSGHFRSKWYRDQFDDWVNGGYHTTDMNDYTGDVLKLVP